MTTHIVLGMDGGTKNFGYGLVKVTCVRGKLKCEVLECGVAPVTVNDMKIAGIQRKQFMKWIAQIVKKHNVTHMIAERFMTRGGASMGVTIECISYMYGCIDQKYDCLELIPAAVWKNQVNKVTDLKAWYDDSAYLGENHELDAILQATYLGHKLFNLKPTYECINVAKINKEIEKMSTCVATINRIAKTRFKSKSLGVKKDGIVNTATSKATRNNNNGRKARS